jgi:hypothetical protein
MKNLVKICVGLFFLVGAIGAMEDQGKELAVKPVEEYRRLEVEKFEKRYTGVRSDIDKIFTIAYVTAKQICNEQSNWKNINLSNSNSLDVADNCAYRCKERYKKAYEMCEEIVKWYGRVECDSQQILFSFQNLLKDSEYEQVSSDFINNNYLRLKKAKLLNVLMIKESDRWEEFAKQYGMINKSYENKISELKIILQTCEDWDLLEEKNQNEELFKVFRGNVWTSFESLEHDIVEAYRLVSINSFKFDEKNKDTKIGINVEKNVGEFSVSSESKKLLEICCANGLKFDQYIKNNAIKGSVVVSWSPLKIAGTLTLSAALCIALLAYYHGYFQKIYSN